MKKNIFISLILMGVILLSYQNCSVYESEGRKQLTKLLATGSANDCLPYLDNNIAALIFNDNVATYLSAAPPAGSQAECRILSTTEVPEGINFAVCGLSNGYNQIASYLCGDGHACDDTLTTSVSILDMSLTEQIQTLDQDPSNFIEVMVDPEPEVAGQSYGYGYSYRVGSAVVVRFVGAFPNNSLGVACYMVYPTQTDYDDITTGKTEAMRRLSGLAHEISNNQALIF